MKRLKIDRNVRIQVQIHPIMPFIGETIGAGLVNLSAGGMAIAVSHTGDEFPIRRGSRVRLHFRLPGGPLSHCVARVSHVFDVNPGLDLVGLKFLKLPQTLRALFERMVRDNDECETRLREVEQPWCDTRCAFRSLCRKPLRTPAESGLEFDSIEIALQAD